jgi:NTP pyrophosphatase (non-canonical NTP hydrolase)
MSQRIDLNRYTEFVSVVTSAESNDTEALINRMRELDKDTNVALLTTAAIGLASEGGEFNEIVKKMLFQGKPFNQDNRFHLMRELGDIIWYWTNACRALGYDPNEVVAENVRKLESRYPGGTFNSWYSENRMDGDI